MLHGYGSNEDDLFSFARELPAELCIISIRAPHPLMASAFAWYAINFDENANKWTDKEQAKTSLNSIVSFIDQAVETYDLDPNNVTLLGFSQGAILSYALALSYPEKVKNVIALSGYIEVDILATDYVSNDFSELSFYASHGSVDQVIPVEWARNTPPLLKSLNIEHVYEEFPVGHGVAPQNFFALKSWLDKRI
jgi:phospholipase/carboxylesterase